MKYTYKQKTDVRMIRIHKSLFFSLGNWHRNELHLSVSVSCLRSESLVNDSHETFLHPHLRNLMDRDVRYLSTSLLSFFSLQYLSDVGLELVDHLCWHRRKRGIVKNRCDENMLIDDTSL